MMLTLKPYQDRCLEDLAKYLESAALQGGKLAFMYQVERAYHSVPQLPGLPYVCLRVPTGGGKTLMACHAVGLATEQYLRAERALCLWLVPSNAILEQTLKALRDRSHPYYQALAGHFSGEVRVMDVSEALSLSRGDAEGAACVIVSTLQAFRVEETDGRKVYEASGLLMQHFSGLDPALEEVLELGPDRKPVPSLCNLLRLHRPVVIVDEAHNARTSLSFDTLARFRPSCILEFTATPQTNHAPDRGEIACNVLCHVSARELKADGMVKLPIHLKTWADWHEAVADALQMQRELERLAREEEKETGEYLRPIVLFQAQARSQQRETLTPDVLKKALADDFRVPPAQIAIATGGTREIDGVDLKDRTQPIRFIITVQALKEGWDCPFAYILCALAETGSARAVEQVLGRILRLPGATKKHHAELDCAYAFVTSDRFAAAATQLRDALVANGFERMEADDLVGTFEEPRLPLQPGGLFAPRGEVVSQAPDLAKLPESLRSVIQYDPQEGTISIPGAASESDVEALQSAFDRPEDKEAIRRIVDQKKARVTPRMDVQARPPFVIPALALRTGSRARLFDEEPLLEIAFDLNQCSPDMPEDLFPPAHAVREGDEAVIDVTEDGRLDVQFKDELHGQLQKLWSEPDWTIAALAGWLDRHVRHMDVGQAQFALFAHGVVTYLVDRKGWKVGALGRQRFRLAAALQAFVAWHRDRHRNLIYQQFLFGPEKALLEVSPEVVFTLTEEEYAPHEFFRGVTFARHAFSCVGELNDLELECARLLDSHRVVKRWVRNIECRPTSFWLQTPSDKFYPDFLAELVDGRYLVVECKGEDRWSNDDSKEKRAIGDLWAERSNGKCLFVMPNGSRWAAITEALDR